PIQAQSMQHEAVAGESFYRTRIEEGDGTAQIQAELDQGGVADLRNAPRFHGPAAKALRRFEQSPEQRLNLTVPLQGSPIGGVWRVVPQHVRHGVVAILLP